MSPKTTYTYEKIKILATLWGLTLEQTAILLDEDDKYFQATPPNTEA